MFLGHMGFSWPEKKGVGTEPPSPRTDNENQYNLLTSAGSPLGLIGLRLIGHFRRAQSLCFKARRSVFDMKMIFYLNADKLVFTRKLLNLASF